MTMSIKTFLAAALVAGSALTVAPVFAAEGTPEPPQQSWSFSGPFGKFDRAQLQRGFKVYRDVCASCHSINLLSFRNLSQPGGPEFSEGQVKALAAEYKIPSTDDNGEPIERAGLPADRFPAVYANEKMARARNGGALPPDMSLLAKARTYERGFPRFIVDIFSQYQEQGPDYIYALLTGYENPPAGVTLQPGQYYNKYMPGHLISMAEPLPDGRVDYPKDKDGKPLWPETTAQYSKDVTAFLVWAAEPHMEARKAMGFKAIIFLVLFAGLLYFTKKRVWSKAPGHAHA
jgi:ubiquinol-cytochrome c reductase cytochrome c1 subunit